ncbi:MAG: DUF2726 domain-containing protein [Phycisphaerae bacterium]
MAMMFYFLVLVVVALAALLLLRLPGRGLPLRSPAPVAELPYRAIDRLLSPTELAFYRALQQAVGPHQLISCKVRLTDVLTCNAEAGKQGFRGKIAQKHVDFVLFDPEDARIIAAIELDDSTHNRRSRQTRDAFLDDAFRAANVPLHHLKAAATYDVREVKSQLRLNS